MSLDKHKPKNYHRAWNGGHNLLKTDITTLSKDWASRNGSIYPDEHAAEVYAAGYCDGLACNPAHRICHNEEHDPENGKLAGLCIVCQMQWPCESAAAPALLAECKRQREEIAKLREALEVARTSYKAALNKEGYEWTGDDCAQIDAALKSD